MLFLPTLLKGIGSGMGIIGQFAGASQREKTADLNYSLASQNAAINRDNTLIGLEFDSIRNSAALADAEYNFQLASLDAEARSRNAERLRKFAEVRTEQGREAIRRQKRAFDQFESRQRASIGSSGVMFSGSALDVLAESAGQMQLAIQDAADQVNFERDDNLNRAGLEEFGAVTDRNRANAGLRSARNAFSLNESANRLGKLSAESNYQGSLFGAAVKQTAQYETAQSERFGAVQGIFAGAAGFIEDQKTIQYKGIR